MEYMWGKSRRARGWRRAEKSKYESKNDPSVEKETLRNYLPHSLCFQVPMRANIRN